MTKECKETLRAEQKEMKRFLKPDETERSIFTNYLSAALFIYMHIQRERKKERKKEMYKEEVIKVNSLRLMEISFTIPRGINGDERIINGHG